MKKVFISQPMRGKSKKEINAARKQAENMARELFGNDVEFIDTTAPIDPLTITPKHPDAQLLGKAIEAMADADMAFFAPGWQAVPGCRIEHAAALAYGIPVCDQY